MPSDWTIDTLKEHFEAMQIADRRAVDAAFAAQKSAIDAALTAADRAVLKAEGATEKRFESVNEFRNTLKDQQASFVLRTEADAEYKSLNAKVDALTTRLDKSEGKGFGLRDGWGYLIAAIGIIVAIVTLWKR